MKIVYKKSLISNTVPEMSGATALAAGSAGLVPAPSAGDNSKFLRGDGTWGVAGNASNFIGTNSEWEQLSQSQKDAYDTVDITDDFNGMPIDATPTANSTNPVQSGGVYDAIEDVSDDLVDEISTRAKLGAHNLLPMLLSLIKSNNTAGSWSGNTYTISDIHFTVNSDLSISVTTEPTGATAPISFILCMKPSLISEAMILTGCPSGGSNDTYSMSYTNMVDTAYTDLGSGVNIPSPFNYSTYPNSRVVIIIKSGVIISSAKVFKPLIKLATDPSTTYTPYAMTNRELTKSTLYFTSVACAATTGNFATVSDANISADHVVVECTFANPSAITTDVTWTTAAGSLTLNGTCASATTANITLSRKGN